MSLNAREERSLGRIAIELLGSDPQLASLLDGFNRMASGEAMPAGHDVVDGRRRGARQRARSRLASRISRESWAGIRGRAVIAAWIFTAAALIAVALALSHAVRGNANPGECRYALHGICGAPLVTQHSSTAVAVPTGG